jgi:hypothetical protein
MQVVDATHARSYDYVLLCLQKPCAYKKTRTSDQTFSARGHGFCKDDSRFVIAGRWEPTRDRTWLGMALSGYALGVRVRSLRYAARSS